MKQKKRNSNYVVEFNNITKLFNKAQVLKNISIKLDKNKFIAIMGPSGAGKTTFLNLASGLEKPDSGKIYCCDYEVSKLKEPKLTKFRARNISYIFQDYNLVEYLNVLDNVMLGAKLSHTTCSKNDAVRILTQLGLERYIKSNVNKLSGGQKQRVAIARALASQSQLIVADEPTGALDIMSRENVLNVLKKSAQQFQKSVLLVTHDPQVAAKADQVIYLLDAKVHSVSGASSAEQISAKLLELEKLKNA